MRTITIRPTGTERRLGTDELIVTKTDTKGIIRYANEVFLRMSAYTEDEVIGQPHNMIRHPDMPRAIFRMLWESVAAGQEVFAYVLNLAGDGAHYWVVAHITPSFDQQNRIVGYHSNRRCPDPGAVRQIADAYRQIVAAEREQSTGSAALDASCAAMRTFLGGRGQTYEQFFWAITPTGRA